MFLPFTVHQFDRFANFFTKGKKSHFLGVTFPAFSHNLLFYNHFPLQFFQNKWQSFMGRC